MQDILTSLELVSPLLLLVAIGYFLNKIHILDERVSSQISKLVLYVLLPVNVFISIYESDFKSTFDIKYVLFIVISNLFICLILIIIAHILTKDTRKLSLIIQACRGNYSILGLPLALNICGEKVSVYMAIAIALLSPLYSIFSIIVFEHYDNVKSNILKQIFNVLKSPLTISAILGVVLNLANVYIPDFVLQTLNYMSIALTGISLLNLGSTFKFRISKRSIKILVIIILFKLIIFPALSIGGAVLLGYRDEMLVAIYAVSAVPVAVAYYATAACYNCDKDLASLVVVYSHCLSAITLPLILAILFNLSLI